jgi:hypothetical protein
MGLNRTRGDNYSSVRVTTSIVLDPGNDCYGVNAVLGVQATLTTPAAFTHQAAGEKFCSTDDRWKIYDLGLNASTQPILVAAGAGMSFLGGATTIAITISAGGVQLTVLDDGVTIQVDNLAGVAGSGGGSALSQIPWYFDFSNVTGLASDLNSGADATHPLLTWNGGFIARVGKDGAGPWAVAPILHFMSSQPNPNADGISFIPTNLPFGIPGGSFAALIFGTVTVKVAAGNILAAVTAKNRSAPANGQLLTLTFQGAAAGNVAALDFLQNTTGGKVSNSWARTNVGANQFTAFQPITPLLAGTFPTLLEFDTWAAGDTVQVSSIPKVYADALAGPVIVQNVEIAQVNAQGVNLNGGTFQECRMSAAIDPTRTKICSFQNCTLAFQGNRYQAPSCFLQAGGTAGTSGATFHLGAGSVATLDTYLGSTGGGQSYTHELTIEAAYIDSGGLLLAGGDNTLQSADPHVAGSPFMWGPGNLDISGVAELLINAGNAVASILNQGGLAGAVTCVGQQTGLFLDSVAAPAVFSASRNITAALLDTDGHAGGGFRNGVGGTVACRSNQGGGGIRSGVI